MNWEGSVLNRIYKTLDFKINPPNYNKLAQNAKLSVIEKNIEKLTFYELNNDKYLRQFLTRYWQTRISGSFYREKRFTTFVINIYK